VNDKPVDLEKAEQGALVHEIARIPLDSDLA
jgi:hypothetical protein